VYNYAVEARDEESLIAGNVDEMRMQALVVRERILGPRHSDTIMGLHSCALYYHDLHGNRRCIDMAKYALQNSCFLTFDWDLHTLVMLLWDIFDKDPANVQFADVSKVLKMTVAGMEVQVKRLAAVLRLAMLEMFIHLVYVACRLMSTEAEISFVERVVRTAFQTQMSNEKGSYVSSPGRRSYLRR